MAPIPSLKLNDGHEIPMLAYGFGTANFMGQDEDMVKATLLAIDNGFYHLDCAECYKNEAGVGAGIKASGVDRSKLYVTTKVVGTIDQDVAAAIDASLSKLGLDYVDLYLLHVPFSAGSPEGLQKIWAQMEAVQAAGKARSIGVSNFEVEDFDIILKTAKVVPAINQIEYHPYLQQRDVVDFCRKKGIAVSAYSPLAALTAARPGPVDETYAELASKYGVSEGDIALRWCLDQNIAVVTTSKSDERLRGFRTNTLRFKLEPEEIQKISDLGTQKHYQGIGIHFMSVHYGNYKTGQAAP
ncbi:NADP-dependent oxidoreductase domain-containing protein [Nemania sp. NC0429]|nr:NADP-dependent oxidoreductase domain-containing protein [Nemania sp. NC0429]